MGPPDVRDHETALSGLLHAVWSTPAGEAPRVSVDVPRRNDAADHFLCLPTHDRARMLLPQKARAARAVAAANLALRHPRQRFERTLLAAALATGAPQRLLRGQRLRIEVADTRTPSLLAALRDGWRHDVAAVGLSVRQITPNYKPSLVAVDRTGAVIGYAKVGWNDATRERLAVESAALTTLSAGGAGSLRVPQVEAELTWNGRRILVVRPLPAAARPYFRQAAAPLTLVRSALAGPHAPRLHVRAVADKLLASVTAHAGESLEDRASAFAARLVDRYGDLDLPLGTRHGDWVPWNLGTADGQLWAWDWEYAEHRSTPLLDIAHWHLQVARFVEHRAVEEAFAVLEDRLARDLVRLGLGRQHIDAVRHLAALELTERQAALAAGTGMWREGVRPGLLGVLSR